MARQKIVQRAKDVLTDVEGEDQPMPMLVVRGKKNIKPPTTKEIQGMKNRQFQRKNPFTNA